MLISLLVAAASLPNCAELAKPSIQKFAGRGLELVQVQNLSEDEGIAFYSDGKDAGAVIALVKDGVAIQQVVANAEKKGWKHPVNQQCTLNDETFHLVVGEYRLDLSASLL